MIIHSIFLQKLKTFLYKFGLDKLVIICPLHQIL